MISKLNNQIRYELRRIKQFFCLLSDFSVADSYKLSFHKKWVSKTNFIYFKPKKWSHNIKIRNSYRDLRTIRDVFLSKYHLPPKGTIITKGSIVVDLGCNTGITIAHLKNIYPDVKIIGYEMDRDNFLLAKRNTQTLNNVYIYNMAIWIDSGWVEYYKHSDYDGYSIYNKSIDNKNTKVKGATLMDLIKRHQLEKIDYLKMDIEGAEKDILNHQDLQWLDYVNAMNIELHLIDEKSLQAYIEMLNVRGFCSWKDYLHVSSIMAIKNKSNEERVS